MGSTATSTTTEERVVGKPFPPLFPEPNDDGKQIYAEDIAKVIIYRQFPGYGGKSRRIKMATTEYKLPDGSVYIVNPFTTDEDELEQVFGGGEYYLQPLGHDGARLPCARTIALPGPMKPGVEKTYLHQSMFGAAKNEESEAEQSMADSAVLTMVQRMLDAADKRASELAAQLAQQQAAAQAAALLASQAQPKPTGPDEDVVRSLRLQIDQMMANHRAQLDEKSKAVDDERALLRKAASDAQEEYNSKRRFIENELQTLRATKDAELQQTRATAAAEVQQARSKAEGDLQQLRTARDVEISRDRSTHEDEIRRIRDEHRRALDDERKRFDDERIRVAEERKRSDEFSLTERKRFDEQLAEERRKRTIEVDEVSARFKRRIDELEREVSDSRVKFTKQLTETMKENLDLRKDLTDTPIPDEPPPPPRGSESSGPNPNDPAWFRAVTAWGPPIVKAVGDFAKNQAQQAAQQQQAPQVAPSQQYVQQQPFQQAPFVPPQQQFRPVQQPTQQPAFVPPVQAPQAASQNPAPQAASPNLVAAPPDVFPVPSEFNYGPAITFPAGEGEQPLVTEAADVEMGGGWSADVNEEEAAQ